MTVPLSIIADENIPYLDHFFGDLGQVTRLPGRTMTHSDLSNADVLLVRSVTQVDKPLLADTSLKFVGSCTIGTDHLAVSVLNESDIAWANAPGCNASSVVQYVLSAMAALQSDWRSKKVGVVGGGNVGGALIKTLQALAVDCYCFDPLIDQTPDYMTSFDEVLSCDIISCHTPLTTNGTHPTIDLLDAAALAKITSGSLLISAGRGGVINEAALLNMMDKKNLKVALDVWQGEPEISQLLLQAVDIASPHIAGYSLDGKVMGTFMVYQALCDFLHIAPVKRMPKLEQLYIDLPVSTTFNDHLLSAYDVEGDSQRLMQHRNSAVFAEEFDRLRKHYPLRRDYSGYDCAHPEWPLLTQ